jgi:PAS domain S-box-containing protein
LLSLKDKTGNLKVCKFDISVISGTEYPERVFLIGNNETEKEDLRNDIVYRSGLQSILFASETDAIIVWHENDVIYHNKKFLALFGYSDKEMRGLNKFDLFSPIQANDIVDVLPNLFLDTSSDTMNSSTFEVVCKKKQGEEFYATISVSKHLFISRNVFVLTVNDISEKKQLENIIHRLNNKTDSLITSLVEGIWIFNNEYKTIYLSQIALEYLDYSFEDVQEKRIFYFIKDGLTDFDKNYFEESHEAKYLNLNVSFIKKEGDIFQTYVNMVPLKNEKSQFMGGILSMRDLSDISDKDVEIEKLNEYKSGLDKQIISLKKDLEDARQLIDHYKSEAEKLISALGEKIESTKSVNDELNATNKQLVRLSTIIQSNLKNHISNISGFSDFMSKVWNEITPEQQLEYFNILLTNSRQASHTFDKILLLSNIALNKIDIQREIINIATKIEKVLEPKLDKFNAKQISLDYKLNQHHYVNADMKLIDFVLNEVISNSLKYTKQNGEVKIEVVEIENMINVSIRDNGIGIAPDKLKNIFDYDESSKLNNFGNRAGSRLSLFIVKEILQLQEGDIEISSIENEGTEVIITLPSDKKTICFVGSESNSEIIRNILDSHYPDFLFVFSSALVDLIDEISSGTEPSVIFLTAFLPEDEFVLYVKQLRNVYNKPIIVVSSEFSDEFKNELLMNNIFTFIPLPLLGDDVENILARIIH